MTSQRMSAPISTGILGSLPLLPKKCFRAVKWQDPKRGCPEISFFFRVLGSHTDVIKAKGKPKKRDTKFAVTLLFVLLLIIPLAQLNAYKINIPYFLHYMVHRIVRHIVKKWSN